jgi:hypothetical protein
MFQQSSPNVAGSPTLRAEPSQRLDFIRRHLGDHDAVRLIITEAADAHSNRMAGPLAHALTIERNGKGFKIQDITVDADNNFTVGEHRVTRHGRFVEVPGGGNVTRLSDLRAVFKNAPPTPKDPASRYRDYSQQSLIDRLVVNERITNETKQAITGEGIVIHKSEFDAFIKNAIITHLGYEVHSQLRSNALQHPLKQVVDELLPLAKARAAQVQLGKTLATTGLAGFTFSGNDMM